LLKSVLSISNSDFLLLASAYFVYGFLMQVGVDQGYDNSANSLLFTHAGDNEINCNIVTLLLE
jgi:hypothetical protein